MRTAIVCAALALVWPTLGSPSGWAGPDSIQAQEISREEYVDRRAEMLREISDGILLLHARAAGKDMEQWGFIQDPTFLYFTGLSDLPAAILALDGPRGESRLFLSPPPISFGMAVPGLIPEPGDRTAEELGFASVQAWDHFQGWLDRRLDAGVAILYVDEPRRPVEAGLPAGLGRVSGSHALWRSALQERFPAAMIASVKETIRDLRWVKSPAEVSVLRTNATTTAAALLAVAGRLRHGLTQRAAEAAVVNGCIEGGAQGPSFWPWVMSGPNARVERLVASFYRYENLDRQMRDGELVRVDIGCAGGLYGGDVGRTLPVSGRFTEGQREAWDLLVHGYLAGLNAMAPGVELDVVRDASVTAIEKARGGLETRLGQQAADALLASGRTAWHIHGVGIESGEDPGPRLEAGSVLAYEPGVSVDGDAYYLEDMILITATGHEVLSTGLPYSADEVEAAMVASRARAARSGAGS